MVYIDDLNKRYKNGSITMIMCHMIADSHSELLQMADKIGLDRKHIQKEGTQKEHFDVCKEYKHRAIKEGAKEITKRELSKMIKERDYELYDH